MPLLPIHSDLEFYIVSCLVGEGCGVGWGSSVQTVRNSYDLTWQACSPWSKTPIPPLTPTEMVGDMGGWRGAKGVWGEVGGGSVKVGERVLEGSMSGVTWHGGALGDGEHRGTGPTQCGCMANKCHTFCLLPPKGGQAPMLACTKGEALGGGGA